MAECPSCHRPLPEPGLTLQQARVLATWKGWAEDHGIQPTLREMAKLLGIRAPTLYTHLGQLEEKGYMERMKRRQRSWRVIALPEKAT